MYILFFEENFPKYFCEVYRGWKRTMAQRVPDTRPLPEIFSIPEHARFSFKNHRVFRVYPEMTNRENTQKYPKYPEIPRNTQKYPKYPEIPEIPVDTR